MPVVHRRQCPAISLLTLPKSPPLLLMLRPQAALHYSKLDLQPFYAGALVRYAGDYHRVADPVR
jgi:hypothetical protein